MNSERESFSNQKAKANKSRKIPFTERYMASQGSEIKTVNSTKNNNLISAQISCETMSMAKTVYGADRPKIFGTIQAINTLLEKQNSKWSKKVHNSFNGEIQKKMEDKQYW